jgi:hypothetical protein
MVRLLVEDATLIRTDQITVQIRFKGGATRALTLPVPLSAWKERTTSPDVIRQIDQLLDTDTDAGIAAELNRRGCQSGMKLTFTAKRVAHLRRQYGLKSQYDRLRARGMLTADEMAAQLGISIGWVGVWRRHGLLRGHPYNDKNWCLYEPVGNDAPSKQQGTKLSERRMFPQVQSHAANEVHHEA